MVSDEGKGRNVWQIAPGRRIDNMWGAMFNDFCIAVGWGPLDSMMGRSKEEIANMISKKPDDNDVLSIFNFVSSIKRGDVVIAKKGNSKEAYGIGMVTKEFYVDEKKAAELFPEKLAEYCNFIDVDWVIDLYGDNGGKPYLFTGMKTNFVQHTLAPVKSGQYKEIKKELKEKYSGELERMGLLQIGGPFNTSLLNEKKQIILYGLPRAEKAFITKKVAVELLLNNRSVIIREESYSDSDAEEIASFFANVEERLKDYLKENRRSDLLEFKPDQPKKGKRKALNFSNLTRIEYAWWLYNEGRCEIQLYWHTRNYPHGLDFFRLHEEELKNKFPDLKLKEDSKSSKIYIEIPWEDKDSFTEEFEKACAERMGEFVIETHGLAEELVKSEEGKR